MSIYKLPVSKDVPKDLHGMELETKEFIGESAVPASDLFVDDAARDRAAQAQYDINVQRVGRDWSSSDDVAKFLKDGDLDSAQTFIQEKMDAYRYGGRGQGPGGGEAAKKLSALRAAAANNPELAAQLSALGI